MKITAIQTSNFLGARAVDVKLSKPVALFAGKNGAGKSSLQEAVRMALVGEPVRVAHKKDFGELVSDQQTVGYAEVDVDGVTAFVTLPDGKTTPLTQFVPPAALPYVLDAQRFSSLDAKARGAFLFELMGLKSNGAAVKQRLTATETPDGETWTSRGCDAAKVDVIIPFLRSGFEAAHKEAQAKARECKASWKMVTGGEAYGSVKAATWQATKPEVNTAELEQARADLNAVERELESEAQRLGSLRGRAAQIAEQAEKLKKLRAQSGMYARFADKLERDKAGLKELEAKVEATRAKAGMKPEQNTAPHPCPHCGGMLLIHEGQLEAWEEETLPRYDAEAASALPEYERSLTVMRNAVANGERDVAAADAAARTLKDLEAGDDKPDTAAAEIAALEARIDVLKHSRGNYAAAIRLTEEIERRALEADQRTAKAAALHADVQAWDAIASALAPDGIPGDMLAEALAPINARLEQSAVDAQWPRVTIDSDMSIYSAFGEGNQRQRPYALHSESEKWRVDAMIAEAVSHLSGLKLLTLDRFDVLDLHGRKDLIAWLEVLAGSDELDTAILTGTLKAEPAETDVLQTFWIERGVCLADDSAERKAAA